MRRDAVPWRIVFITLALVGLITGSAILILRSQGFDAVDADATRATRWFVDKASDRIVLVDGYGGRALARVEPDNDTVVDDIVQDGAQATVLDRTTLSTRYIDGSTLKLGPSQPLPVLADPSAIIGIGSAGVVAVDPAQSTATIVPQGAPPIRVEIAAGANRSNTRVGPDGSIWTLIDQRLRRTTATETSTVMTGLEEGDFTLVGDRPFVLDRANGRWRFGEGNWVDVPAAAQLGDMVLQEPSPNATCGWAGVDDTLYCVGSNDIENAVSVNGLDIDGGDLFAISGDVAVVVDRSTGQILRLDWRRGAVAETRRTELADANSLRVATSVDLVWVDAVDGATVWSVNPWGMHSIEKDDASTPLIGEGGETIGTGEASGVGGAGGVAVDGDAQERPPDGNNADDPPIAVDDSVSARSGVTVPINVTANDYDPDGEAIAVVSATAPSNGSTSVASATTVTYQPSVGYVGIDTFEYTIVDGDGTEATATVTVELVSPDAPNQAPVGAPDVAQTGPGKPIMIDVLLNDVDPERDALRISTFTADISAGSLKEVTASSGLPGLQFSPAAGFFGEAELSYTPMDALGAVGEPVKVMVDVAAPGTENRAPIAKPDAIRVRRGVTSQLAVLANDIDPDGDTLRLELVDPLPDSVKVDVAGDRLEITALAGSGALAPIAYRAIDPGGLEAIGSVLVSIATDSEPNRPPVANADTATVVADGSTTIDVLANDSDPDGDPIRLLSAQSLSGKGTVRVEGDQLVYEANPLIGADSALDRVEYEIDDGNGHRAEGSVSVRVIAEPLPEPPVALDDSVTTQKDTAVVIDVLANDSDPSGESLAIVGKPGCPSGGAAVVTTNQLVRFTPPPSRSGVFACSYEVANASGLKSVANITISVVNPVVSNRPPLVISEERTVRVGESVTVDVLANDTDPDGAASDLRLLNSTTPTSGKAVRNADGTITYQAPNEPVVVSIGYDVIDAGNAIASGRLVIRVIGQALVGPAAAPDLRVAVAPVSELLVDVLANDSDPDGTAAGLALSSVKVLSGSATASIVDRQVRIVPSPGYLGEILAEYTISDPDGLTATGLITVTITAPVNRPPEAGPDSATVAAGETVVVPIGLNDLDPDGDPLVFTLAEPPPASVGTATVTGSTLVFVATIGAAGPVTMRYTVSDGTASATATVTVNVIGCTSSPPVASDGFIETGYQQPIDIDLNKYAANGKVVDVSGAISAPVARYTPPFGENGNVTVSFAVENACGARDTGTLTIDVNQDPVGGQYEVDLARNTTTRVGIDKLASDDEPLQITSLVRAPTWVQIVAGRRAIELSPGAVSGRVNFSVVVTDPGGLKATVPIVAVVQNRPPNANEITLYADRVDFSFTLMSGASDPDGDELSYQSLPSAVSFNGRSVPLVTEADNRLRLDLTGVEGSATFLYTVQDQFGLASRQTTAKIETRWTPPEAADAEVQLERSNTVTRPAPVSDPDGQALTLSLPTAPTDPPAPLEVAPGVTVEVSGLNFVVTAGEAAAPGSYLVDYAVADTGGRRAQAKLKITVLPTTTPSEPNNSSPVSEP